MSTYGRSAFDAAKLAMATERGRSGLFVPFVDLFPVNGAALSLLGERVGQSTLSASNPTAARLDELQFDLGEGPCWEALASRGPVLAPDIDHHDPAAWPTFSQALHNDEDMPPVGAMFAFPLAVGALDLGAVDLYSHTPTDLSAQQVEDASSLASLASIRVLRLVMEASEPGASTEIGTRREVNQATGMVLAQLGISAEDAGLLLRAHAFATGRTVLEVAVDVIDRRLDFSAEE